MNLNLELSAAEGYKSASQKARVITEAWALSNMYCPVCTCNSLKDTTSGTQAIDFVCPSCNGGFQLKAANKPIGRKVVDSAYEVMIRAINENRLPHFLIMSYDFSRAIVNDFLLIPNFCFSKSAIEARKPLKPTARRAGWVGCNIILDDVPPEGKISIIRSGQILPKSSVRTNFMKVQPLATVSSSKERGWTLDVLTALRSIKKSDFTLDDAYLFESTLSRKHPENFHVRDKIRQQLQVLRDLGYLEFVSRGFYKWTKK